MRRFASNFINPHEAASSPDQRTNPIDRVARLAHRQSDGITRLIGSPAMNFIPCRLEQNGAGMRVRVSDAIAFPVPASNQTRYRPTAGKELVLGLRPEHITEPRHDGRDDGCDFTATLDVVEPMGMETMVFFTVNGTEICGQVEPSSASTAGTAMRLHANIDHMHLIDPANGAVI